MSNILLLIILSVFGLLIYLYFLWEALREDYDSSKIFTLGFSTFFALVIGLVLGIFITGKLWFWTAFICLVVASILMLRRLGINKIEAIEAGLPGLLILYLGVFVYGFTSVGGRELIVMIVTILLSIFLYFILRKYYKRINWYKSGRLGFASLTTVGFIFLVRAIVSVISPNTFSFIGIVGFIPSAIVSFLSFFTVYNLSESN